jgi:transmembrane sensor
MCPYYDCRAFALARASLFKTNQNNFKMAEESRIAELIFKQLQHCLSLAEKDELEAWIDASDANRIFADALMNRENLLVQLQALLERDDEAIERKMRQQLLYHRGDPRTDPRAGWTWGTAVAGILAILGCITFFLTKGGPSTAIAEKKEIPVHRPQLTGIISKRPSVQISDGPTIYLDGSNDGVLWEKDGIKLIKTGRQITYLHAQKSMDAVAGESTLYHTFSIPYGQSWKLSLPDHSKVQLDAGTALSYPVVDSGKGATGMSLVLRGKARFEVSSHPDHPFIVNTAQSTVAALATVFDVEDYIPGKGYRTVVLRGAVNVTRGGITRNVRQGQSAIIRPSSGEIVVEPFDTIAMPDWSSAYFDLTELNVRASLLQLSQWYGIEDIDIHPGVDTVSKGLVKAGKFMKTSGHLDELLEMLGNEHLFIRREGNKLVARPYKPV